MLRLALLALAGPLLAAEPDQAKEVALTSTSRTGESHHLIAKVPAGFTATLKDLPAKKPETLQAISAESEIGRAHV